MGTAAVDATAEAELPYLKGIEVLPAKETQETLEKSEKAITDLEKALSEARAYVSAKQRESQAFAGAEVKTVREGLTGPQDSINKGTQRLAEFKKATTSRKRAALIQEIVGKVDALEEEQ